MIIGNKETFAIEYSIVQGNEYVFIELCYWANNQMIGELEQRNLLSAVVPLVDHILVYQGKRAFNTNPLKSTSDKDILEYFIENTWDNEDKHSKLYQTLNILDIHSNESETFSGFFIFLIEEETHDRLLCKDVVYNQIIDCKLPKNVFYACFETFKQVIHQTI